MTDVTVPISEKMFKRLESTIGATIALPSTKAKDFSVKRDNQKTYKRNEFNLIYNNGKPIIKNSLSKKYRRELKRRQAAIRLAELKKAKLVIS